MGNIYTWICTKMAAIVRVKRRFDEDPANSLLLSCKRFRSSDKEDEIKPSSSEELTSVFKFAGTLPTKQTDVTNHVRDAIRREKRQQEYKRQQHVDIVSRSRSTHSAAANKNRFKIVSSRRAVDLDSLDKETTNNGELSSEQSDNACSPNTTSNCNNKTSLTSETSHKDSASDLKLSHDKPSDEHRDPASQSQASLFCLYDIEEEPKLESETKPQGNPEASDTITCNGVAMVREKTKPKPPGDNPERYVYDIYYMNAAGFDFRALENILAIEAYGGMEAGWDGARGDEGQECGEDEDSNDEDNWRNDYPDEEGNNVVDLWEERESGPESEEEEYSEDYGMSRMVQNRLKICDTDESSSDDDGGAYSNQSAGSVAPWRANQSYDSYKQQLLRQLKPDDDEEEAIS